MSWARIAALAAITGARTSFGPALVLRAAARRPMVRAVASGLATLEMIGDKLPRTPARTAPLGLGLRIASATGLAIALRRRRGAAAICAAMAIGVAGAVAGAFAGLRLRGAVTWRFGGGRWANAAAGVCEDAALLAIGTRLVS
jgi:uncharacterized membrane protein